MNRLSRRTMFGAVASVAIAGWRVHTPAWAQDQTSQGELGEDRAPYVWFAEEGGRTRFVAKQVAATGVLERNLRVGDRVEVGAVGDVPAFAVALRAPARLEYAQRTVPTTRPLVVVADTHGELEILVAFLRNNGVIDERLAWSLGRGHLVVLGDMLDRGPNHVEILWLFYKLEAEALRAGGGVHVVLGNHEAMVMRDDLRYLNPRYPRTASAMGVRTYAELLSAETVLGQWLRTKPAVLKINDMLFLHGGVSFGLIDRGLDIDAVNAIVRGALQASAQSQEQAFVLGREGPLWYRGYFPEEARESGHTIATSEDVNAVLQHFGVSRLFVGHTPLPHATSLFEGRVIAVQVYPVRDAASGAPILEGVSLEGGTIWRLSATEARHPLENASPNATR